MEEEEEEEEEEEDEEEDEESDEEEIESEKSDEEEEDEEDDEEDDEEEDDEEDDDAKKDNDHDTKKDNDDALETKDFQADIVKVDLEQENVEETEINGPDSQQDQITNGIDQITRRTMDDVEIKMAAMNKDHPKDESSQNSFKREDTIIPDIFEDRIESNGTEKNVKEDKMNEMIREFLVTCSMYITTVT